MKIHQGAITHEICCLAAQYRKLSNLSEKNLVSDIYSFIMNYE